MNESLFNIMTYEKGIVGDGTFAYEIKSPYSFLRYRYNPTTSMFYLDNIGTPKLEDQHKGHATALLEQLFKNMLDTNNIRCILDTGMYTSSGEAYIKHVVERLATYYKIRLIKGNYND